MNIGDRIRRKNHKKKTRKNNHEILTITGFSKHDGLEMVGLKDSNGKIWSMSKRGLDWYEIVK